jgi:hypothetical protein
MSETTYKFGGLSFTSILTLIFVLCKLTHYIDWSWWWVLSPVLIDAAFGFLVLAIIAIILIATEVLK